MKRLLLSGFLLCWIFSSGQIAQIGTGTDTAQSSSFVPVYMSSATSSTNYFRSNVLYDSLEIHTAGVPSGAWITSIAFYKYGDGGTREDAPLDYKVYMGNDVHKDSLPYRANWDNDILPNHSLVLEDQNFKVPQSPGWVIIPLQTPFHYTGGSLRIAFEGAFGGFGPFSTGTFDWAYTQGDIDYIIGSSSNYSLPSSLSTSSATARKRPNIQISYIESGCEMHSDFSVDSISGTGFEIDWVPGSANTGFYIEYGTKGFNPGSGTIINGTYPGSEPPLYIDGLSEFTTYDVYLNSICNSGNDTAIVSIPYQITTGALCPAPEDAWPDVLGPDFFSLNIGAAADSFDYEIGPVGFEQGSGVLGSGGNPLYIGGLTSQTSYDVYVRSDCQQYGNGNSTYSGPYTFTTSCAAQSLPYRENFNTDLGCMQVINGGNTDDSWISRQTIDWMTIDGSGYAFAEPVYNTIYDEIIVTPVLDASTLNGNLILEFDQVYATSSPGTDAAWIQVYDGTSWVDLIALDREYGSTYTGSEAPDHQEIDITTYANANLQVRFLIEGGRFWLIDNLKVLDVTCYEAENINVSARGSDWASIDYTNASAIQYEYDTVGYTPGNGTQGAGTKITGLSTNTEYDVYVRADCSANSNGYSEWTGPFTIHTFCQAEVAPFIESFEDNSPTRDCWSQDMVLEDHEWTFAEGDGGNIDSAYAGDRNARFTGTRSGPFITRLVTPLIDIDTIDNPKLEFYYAQASYAGNNYLNVYIRDTAISSSWEVVYSDSTLHSSWTKGEIYFSTPGSQVQVAFEGIDTWGRPNVIDSVSIINGPACPEPTQLAVQSIGEDSVVVEFTSSGSNFNYEYGPKGFTPGNGTTGSTDLYPVTVNGLQSSTEYDVYIQTDCSDLNNGTSPWAGPVQITTPCAVSTMLSGTYTIDNTQPTSSTNFNSFNEAAEYLSGCGVTGPVVFNVQSGVYNDKLHIVNAIGVSSVNTVTFNGGGATLRWDSTGISDAPVLIDSTSNITINNLILENEVASFSSAGIRIMRESDSITIDGCTVIMPDDGDGIIVTSNYSFNSSNHYSDYITIRNSKITGAGITVGGGGCEGYVFENNRIEEYNTFGISASSIQNMELRGNILYSATGNTNSRGLNIGDIDDFIIENNDVQGFNEAINLYNMGTSSSATSNSKIVNNMIRNESGNALYLNNSSNIDVFHNTASGQTAFYIDGHDSLDIRNNIFVSSSTAFYSGDAFTSGDVVDYNLYSGDIEVNSTVHASLSAWQTADATNNVNSHEGMPIFLGSEDLHIITSTGADGNADPTLGVTEDIDGESRSATTPDIGADEFEVSSCLPPTELTFSGSDGNSANLEWTSGSASTFNIIYGPEGFVFGEEGDTISGVSNPYNLTGLSPLEEYDYYVQGDCGSGETSRWSATGHFYTTCVDGLDGTFTIDASLPTGGTNFSSIREVVQELNSCGVDGPVVFNIAPGTYNDSIRLTSFFGSSETNTVTFNGGSASDVTLSFESSNDIGTVHLEGADHVTFKNMTIINTGKEDAWGILLTNGSDYITVDSSRIEMEQGDNTDVVGIVSSAAISYASEGNNANHITVSNSEIIGGQRGLRFTGGSLGEPACVDFNILNNTFLKQYDAGIETGGLAELIVDGNTIDSLLGDEARGMVFRSMSDFNITSNEVIAADDAIYIFNGNYDVSVDSRSNLINNVLISSDGYGLSAGRVEQTNIYHNSVVGMSALGMSDHSSIDIRNNIFYASGGVAFESSDALSFADTVDYNLYYMSSGTNLVEIGSSVYPDIASWKTANANKNMNSLEGDPGFVDAQLDLNISGSSTLAYNNGTALGVNVDIIDTPRDLQNPDVGAYEMFCESPSDLEFSNIQCNSVILEWEAVESGEILIEYDTAGFTPGEGMFISGVSSPNFLPGLQPATEYDFYIANVCMNIDTTDFAGPFTMTTSDGPVAEFEFTLGQASMTDQIVDFEASDSTGSADTYDWDFGDGTDTADAGESISHIYTSNGSYIVTLTVSGDCGTDTFTDTVEINEISVEENFLSRSLKIYPNPTSSKLNVSFKTGDSKNIELKLMDVSGKVIQNEILQSANRSYEGSLDLGHLPKGVYMLKVKTGNTEVQRRIIRN